LSYKIIGILFDVYNELGHGYQERIYQRAIAEAFRRAGLKYEEQVPCKLSYGGTNIGRYFLDFLVDNKIVLEIKQGDRYSRTNFVQVTGYLKATGLPLGILANFTSNGVVFKRVLKPTE